MIDSERRKKHNLGALKVSQWLIQANTQYSREIAMRKIQKIGEGVIRVRATKSSAAFDTSHIDV